MGRGEKGWKGDEPWNFLPFSGSAEKINKLEIVKIYKTELKLDYLKNDNEVLTEIICYDILMHILILNYRRNSIKRVGQFILFTFIVHFMQQNFKIYCLNERF